MCRAQSCVAKLLTKHGEKRLRYAFKGRGQGMAHKTIEAILAALGSREGGNEQHE